MGWNSGPMSQLLEKVSALEAARKANHVLSKEGTPAKGFVTNSWRIRCTGNTQMAKEGLLQTRQIAAVKLKQLDFPRKSRYYCRSLFSKPALVWNRMGKVTYAQEEKEEESYLIGKSILIRYRDRGSQDED